MLYVLNCQGKADVVNMNEKEAAQDQELTEVDLDAYEKTGPNMEKTVFRKKEKYQSCVRA